MSADVESVGKLVPRFQISLVDIIIYCGHDPWRSVRTQYAFYSGDVVIAIVTIRVEVRENV